MNIDRSKRNTALSWIFVCLLVALSVSLGVLQYRWIGQVSLAERDRLRAGLQGSLGRLALDFNAELSAACAALLPAQAAFENADRQAVYASQFLHWRETGHHNGLFRRIALAAPEGGDLALKMLDLDRGAFESASWPPEWNTVRDRLSARLAGERRLFGPPNGDFRGERRQPGPPGPEGPGSRPPGQPGAEPPGERWPFGFGPPLSTGTLIELPRFFRFGEPDLEPAERFRPEWLLIDVDEGYVRSSLLPELLQRHLGAGRTDYQVELAEREDPKHLLYNSDSTPFLPAKADAAVPIFEVQFDQVFRRAGLFRGPGRRGEGRFRAAGPDGAPGRGPDRGRWLLSVRHHAGSLEAMVEQVRRRNLAVTTGVLALLLAAVAALMRFTQRAQNLARMQMDFVAGVSHELRTPLTVIRTAAHNLGRGVVTDPRQVQRYGSLIRHESERLGSIVEQVLRFASAKAGKTIGSREPVLVDSLVDDVLASTPALSPGRVTIEKRIDPEVPPVLADPAALRHALQNLVTNAWKYGADGGWIGVSASAVEDGSAVEIKVADRGAGIPAEEIDQIFDPFYRGKWALDNQIHGTGLGLNLVKRIVDAHGGTVTVHSEPGKGAEFVLKIPAAPAVETDEFADSVSRG